MALRSIYDKTSYNKAINPDKGGQYGITFEVNTMGSTKSTKIVDGKEEVSGDDGKLQTVTGILKNSIGWNTKAEWGSLGFEGVVGAIAGSNPVLQGVFNVVQTVNELAGRSFFNTGLFTRKFYKNSGDLSIQPSFRVFDFNNSGVPIYAGLMFTSLCLPKRIDGDTAELQNLVDGSVSVYQGALNNLQGGIYAAGEATKQRDAAGHVNRVLDGQIKTAGYISDNLKGASINWTVQPSTVTVSVGQWLRLKDMVLTDVNVSYSSEMTDAGPLWADFDLTLVTRENLIFNRQNGTIEQIDMKAGRRNTETNKERITFGPN